VLELAAALKRENLERTAAQVQRILRAQSGWAPSDRTLQRLFTRLELNRPPADPGQQQVFGRFEATRPNELWTGDALHGPVIGGRKTYLFCFIDDHSRAVMGARWAFHEDVVRLAAALRPALASRGVPEWVYVDNGSAFVDAWLLRACAVLGIKLVHSRPRRPQGRGKVERFFRTVRDQFLVEITGDGQAGTRAADLAELNRLFSAWVAVSYHRAVHSETGQAPLARWAAGVLDPLPLPSPAQLHEAFRWSERRTVRKTATVSLHGNLYQVDASLVRRVVELVFDPFDLTDIDVRHKGRPAGKAVPFLIGRHRHAKTRTGDDQQRAEPEPTGIDYLNILDQAHGAGLQAQINYAALIDSADETGDHGAGDTGRPGGQEKPRA
jgi:putative transposase